MLTTDDLILNEYIFQSSPESCSDRSYSTDFMDVNSDEDFLTQLSLDLDIPLYLNPGEDELGLLNSHFDKSPEEILSDISSPTYNMEEYTKEDSEMKNIEFSPSYNSSAWLNQLSSVKSEIYSGSEKSNSPVQSDVLIKEEVQIKTPPLSPNSVIVNNSSINDLQSKIIYKQPVPILTPQHSNLANPLPKQIPIVPKTQISLPTKQNNVVVLNPDIKPIITSPPSAKVIVVENVNLTKKIPQIKVECVTPVTTSVNVGSNVIVNRFPTSTTIDPRIFKKQQRKIKNRESASLSRKRKKDYMTSLEVQVKELSDENKRLQVENTQLKQKLAQYEEQDMTNSKSKTVKPSIFLCVVLLVMGVKLDLIRNPLQNKNQFGIIKTNLPKINDHHGRNLLWSSEEIENINNTSSFSPFTMCPASINQTESARLVLELERWIGKPGKTSGKVDITRNSTKEIKAKRKKVKFDGPLTSIYRKHRLRNEETYNSPKTAIQVFSTSPEQIYSDFFEAINRQDDTFYVVSFTDQHMLLPALHHNKTRRPKMSLIMRSVLLNDSVAQGSMIPLMQIDCEVLDTRLIHVKHGSIPEHLRTYANITKGKPSSESPNFTHTDIPKYYKKLYKPFFINKKGIKSNRNFLNLNLT